MTVARLAWRVVGKIIPGSLKHVDDVVSCEVELPDAETVVVEHDGHRLLIHVTRKIAYLDDQECDINPIPFAVLTALARDPRRYYSASELYADVWHGDLARMPTRTVDAAVSLARRSLPAGWVVNKQGKGWRLLP